MLRKIYLYGVIWMAMATFMHAYLERERVKFPRTQETNVKISLRILVVPDKKSQAIVDKKYL